MAAAAILNYYFLMPDHKFRPPKSCFWGVLTPKLYFLSSRPPKGTSLRKNTRFEPSLVVIGPTVWSGWDTKCTKKERTKSKPKFAIFADFLPVVPRQPNFACRVVSRMSFLVLSFRKIGWKMWEQWGVEFLAFPLTWHIAYTTACCYRTSRDLSFYCIFMLFVEYCLFLHCTVFIAFSEYSICCSGHML